MNVSGEAQQPIPIEWADPILNAPGRISQEPAHLPCGHPLCYEEESGEPMIVSGPVGPADPILPGADHGLGVRNAQ